MEGAIVLKEDVSVIQKIWKEIVNLKVKSNQLFIKGAPALCVVCSVFAPEAAPALLALAAFLNSNTGKKLLNFAMKTEEITGDVWQGDLGTAKEKIDNGLDSMLKEDINYSELESDLGKLVIGGK